MSGRPILRLTLAAVVVLLPAVAQAQLVGERPEGVADVGIDERAGEPLPLETVFTTSAGRRTALGELFDGERPVILSFNYTDCPMLCKLQLAGLVDALEQLDWTAGDEYRVVSISIDPSETTQQAAVSKQNHLRAYGRPGAADGWAFLVGSPDAIQTVTDAAGFRYKYLPDRREFSHAAAAIVCTPDGRISRYVYGVQFEPETIRLSLAEAGEGKIGSALDQLILYCYRYDSSRGEYALAAWNLMRLGAIATVLLLAAYLVPLWVRSRAGVSSVVEKTQQPTTQ